ncbi:MAG: SRPBCC domain-containing protein [Pseudomonadota bacterium]|nr:SRPBCC domain-containing protein [Pseudomonadota bacterium]
MSGDTEAIVVRLERSFDASCERVFDAWLHPATIGTWMFGSKVRDEYVVHLKADARVGGDFSFLVRRNGEEVDHIGTYLELQRPHRLVFTWAIRGESDDAPSEVAIDIVERDAGCELTLVHSMNPKWAAYADRTRAAWNTMLEALGRELDRPENN